MNMNKSGHLPLLSRIEARSARVGVIGLGYVGLPLAVTVARAGFRGDGLRHRSSKMDTLDAGRSYIGAVGRIGWPGWPSPAVSTATMDFTRLKTCDAIIICVPTPLTRTASRISPSSRTPRR